MAFSLGRFTALGAVIAVTGLGAAGCNPTINQRGYVLDPTMADRIRVGVDTKGSIQSGLGSPSTMGTFNDNVWYYIATVQEDEMFFRPQEIDRRVVAIRFDAEQRVASVENLGPETAVEVSFSDEETPTRGRELTFLQQIFGNVGRGSALGGINSEENDPRGRR